MTLFLDRPSLSDHLGRKSKQTVSTMLEIKKILVPFDYSEYSKRALQAAWLLAEQVGATVYALHVEIPIDGRNIGDAVKQLESQIAPVKETADVKPRKASFFYTVEFEFSPARAIRKFAKDEDIDLIIMGTHGRRGISRAILGSVASELVQMASQPVLTIRDQPMARVENILLPFDFSEPSREALRHAREMANHFGAKLELLHVIENVTHPVVYGTGFQSMYEVDPELDEKLLNHMEEVFTDSSGPQVEVAFTVLPGHVASVITDYAKDRHDLIVTATHGLSGLSHFLMGSVAEKVVQRSSCPVLVVKTFSKSLVSLDEAEIYVGD